MATTDIASQLRAIDQDSINSEHARKQAVAEARALLTRLETPFETIFRHGWVEPSLMAATETALQLELFQKWVADGGQAMTKNKLQKLVDCDPLLFSRILKHLSAGNIINITPSGSYALTTLSYELGTNPKIASCSHIIYDILSSVFTSLPAWLASFNHTDPTKSTVTNWHFSHHEDFWPWLQKHPRAELVLGQVMAAAADNRPSLPDLYPTEQLLAAAGDADIVLIDMGGGMGHHLEAFNRRHPQKAGRLVLQERPEVIDNARDRVSAAINPTVHDFFTPQPIHGAPAYFMHHVLHDWPDADCLRILSNLKPAMKQGFSKLLVQEIYVADAQPSLEATTLDMCMLGMGSACERTENEWRRLLARAEFQIAKIWRVEGSVEAVIEAVPI